MKIAFPHRCVLAALLMAALGLAVYTFAEKAVPRDDPSGRAYHRGIGTITEYYRGLGLIGESWLGRRTTRIETPTPFGRVVMEPQGDQWRSCTYRVDGTLERAAVFGRSSRNPSGLRIPDFSALTWANSYDAGGNITGEVREGRGQLLSLYERGSIRHIYSDGRLTGSEALSN